MAFKINRPFNPMIECKFCEIYMTCPADLRFPKDGERYCPTLKRNVKAHTISCADVELNRYFYCDRLSCQMDVISCQSRRGKGTDDCGRCGDGDCLSIFIAGKNIQFEKNGMIKKGE
jgi:hypothetical protein